MTTSQPASPAPSGPAHGSESSTVYYGHTPFDSLAPTVRLLAQSIWPAADDDVVEPKRVCGGSFNRIIELRRVYHRCHRLGGRSHTTHYILRIPRFTEHRLSDDVALLQFLEHNEPGLRAPRVVAFDTTPDNPLGAPYMIQKRVPGYNLFKVLTGLCHQHSCQLAAELGHVYRNLLATRKHHAGRYGLLTASSEQNQGAVVYIKSFCSVGAEKPVRWGVLSAVKTNPARFLADTFQARIVKIYEADPNNEYEAELFASLTRMVQRLEDKGALPSGPTTLCHLDLAPRNIIVSFRGGRPMIRGILDWDTAMVAPPCMAAIPPLWLWGPEDEGAPEFDDEKAAEEPETPKRREIKRIFDEAAGPEYVKLAYDPAQRLVRRLIRYAMNGFETDGEMQAAEDMVREWEVENPADSPVEEAQYAADSPAKDSELGEEGGEEEEETKEAESKAARGSAPVPNSPESEGFTVESRPKLDGNWTFAEPESESESEVEDDWILPEREMEREG